LWEPKALEQLELFQQDARALDPEWTDSFAFIFEMGALHALCLSGAGCIK
jgi:hypothetical protein